jgi:hypothetical protein
MGYEMHIVRTRSWLDAHTNPIGREEWNAFAQSHPRLTEDGWIDWKDIGREPSYLFVDSGGEEVSLWWRGDQVSAKGGFFEFTELVALAEELDAMLIGDEWELYTADGQTIDFEG